MVPHFSAPGILSALWSLLLRGGELEGARPQHGIIFYVKIKDFSVNNRWTEGKRACTIKSNGFHIGNDWDELLKGEFDKEYYQKLRKFLASEYRSRTIYPSMYDIFNALKYTPYHEVRAVILGQDPYHGPGQAHGLSFSVQKGVPVPPSLNNIYQELEDDVGFHRPSHGCLTQWAQGGVLLLNTVLTVRAHAANSHRGMGWENFTDRVIDLLNERQEPMVFLLWGANARSKQKRITNPNHLVLTAPHPSPLSAYQGFFGCRHFSQCNAFLQEHGQEPIQWQLEE